MVHTAPFRSPTEAGYDDAGRLISWTASLAGTVADQVRAVHQEWSTQMSRLVKLAREVDDVAHELAEINGQLGGGALPPELRAVVVERRDALAHRLTALTECSVRLHPDGDAEATLADIPLVSGVTAADVSVSGPTRPTVGAEPVVLLVGDSPVSATGGELGRVLRLVASDLPECLTTLEEVAAVLSARTSASTDAIPAPRPAARSCEGGRDRRAAALERELHDMALQAAFGATARAIQPSLRDFLR